MKDNKTFNTSYLLKQGMASFSQTESGAALFKKADFTNDIAGTFVVDFMDSFHKLYALMMTRYGSIPFHDFVVYVLSIKGIKVKTMAQLLSVSVNSIRVKKYRMNHLLNESDLQATQKIKTLFYLICLVFVLQPITAKEYSESFRLSDFKLVETENGKQSQLQFDELEYALSEDFSLPALPFKTIQILIPPFAEISDFSWKCEKKAFASDVILNHNPAVIPVGGYQEVTQTENVTYEMKSYPEQQVEFNGTSIIGGFKMASFVVCPFEYDAVSRKLDFISSLTIDLELSNSPNSSYTGYRADMIPQVSELVTNPDEIQELYVGTVSQMTVTPGQSQLDYVIITADSLADSFLPLRNWKRQKGLHADIVTLTEIANEFSWVSTTDIPLQIKTFLKYKYSNCGLKWVLLGGDDTVVPVRYCYGHVGTTSPTIDNLPCDLFYACMDTDSHGLLDWDLNGNGVYGELGDSIDMISELNVSRFPGRNTSHMNAMIGKVLDYEQGVETGRVDQMLLGGCKMFFNYNSQSDADYKSEKMYRNRIAYSGSEWNGTKYRFYDTNTDFAGGNAYDFSAANIQEQLDMGYHYVHIMSHGSSTAIGTETGGLYTTTYADQLENEQKSVLFTSACHTNAFDSSTDPCLGEAFMRNSEGGSVAYLGSSREGWETEDLGNGPSLLFNSFYYNYLFSPDISGVEKKYAALISRTKNRRASISDEYNANRWVEFSINPMGDPEMPLYTQMPIEFSNVSITYDGVSVTVSTGGIQGCTIALTSDDDAETYMSVAEDVSSATFNDILFPYNVVITKHNYIPYRYNQPDVFIQNHTFSQDEIIWGRNIYIGKNVLSLSPEGLVRIPQDIHVELDASKRVHIKNGVIVESGGKLDIRHND